MINAYSVGIKIGMSSNGPAVLGELLKALTGVHIATSKLTKNLGGIQTAAVGAIAAFAGFKAVEGIWHVVDASRELNKELERTKQLGGDFAKTLNETRKAALQTSFDAPTTTLAGNVRLAREVGTTIGHPEEAARILTQAAKTAEVISHYTGENAEDIAKNLARTADARGQIYAKGADGKEHVDPAKLASEMEAAARALILGGGFIHSGDLLQSARQGGAAVKAQTPEAFYAAGVEAAIAMGASKLGTAETGLMQQLVAGTMTRRVAENLTTAGLLHDGDWHAAKGGSIVMDPKVAQRMQPMMADPVAWLTTGEGSKAIKEYAAKQGIDVMMAIFQLFGRQTVQRLASEVTSNAPQFERARSIYGQIPGVDQQYKELQAHDLDTNIKAVTAAWASFMQALGDAGVPSAIAILQTLTGAIHLFTAAVEAHPQIASELLTMAAGVATVVALGGAYQATAFAARPLIAALSALGATMGGASATGGAGQGLAAAANGAAGSLGIVVKLLGAIGLAYFALVNLPPLLQSIADSLGQKALPPDQRAKHGAVPYSAPGAPPPVAVPQREENHGGRGAKPWHEAPPPAGAAMRPVSMTGDVHLDGQKVGRFISTQVDRTVSGPGLPDLRASPWGASSGASL